MTGIRLLAALAALILAATPGLSQTDAPRTLTVTGYGEVTAAPDLATLTIGAEETAATAREAMVRVAQQMQAMFVELDAAGIAARDRQTRGLSLQPVWNHNRDSRREPEITGYTARNTLIVRVRALNTVGSLIDVLSNAGANRIEGISFGLDDRTALMQEARRLAAADAIARATLYAEALGERLGPVLSFNEAGGFRPPQPVPMARMAMAESADMPVAGGEVALSVTVNVMYKLAD